MDSDGVDARTSDGKKFALSASLRRSFAAKTGLRKYIGPKRIMALAFLAMIVGLGWYLRKYGNLNPAALIHLLEAHPILGPGIFISFYGAAVLTALPTIPFNLAAGFFWGAILGGVFSAMGTTLGSLIAFLMARTLFGRPLAAKFDSRLVTEIQDEFNNKGWTFVAFIRLNPVFPTGPVNYILGLTSISTFTYCWVTLVFLLPSSILVAYIGHSMGMFVVTGDVASALKMLLVVSGVGTLIVGALYGAHLFNRFRRPD